MTFRNSMKENVWFVLLSYEYERPVRDSLEQGLANASLTFSSIGAKTEEEKRHYLREQVTPFICLSVRQSKELFTAAEQASDATKPLLSYYGMMNLVKGLLALDLPDFFEDRANLHHGLSVREGARHSFKFRDEAVLLLPKGVYSLGRQAIGGVPVCAENERVLVRIEDIIRGLPDLYWDYQKIANLKPHEMNTFPIGTPDPARFDAYSQQFYADTYIDRALFEAIRHRLPLDLNEYFNFQEAGGNTFCLTSKIKSGIIQDLVNILNSISTMLLTANNRFIPLKFDCVVENPTDGRRTESVSFTELELMYLLTFYMGSVARYRPHIWDAAISGRENEYVTIFKKFLHYADAKFIALVAARVAQT